MRWKLGSKWQQREPGSRDPTQAGVDSPAQPGADAALGRLSDLYAERVEELDKLRRGLEEIGFILSNHLSTPDAGPLAENDLKHILDLTQYDYDR